MAFRDMSVPYKPEEIEGLRDVFRSLPTYNSQEEYILSTDFPELFRRLRYERNEEQLKTYKAYWDKQQDGKLYMNQCIDILAKIHKTSDAIEVLVNIVDKDQDGFISADEFIEMIKVVTVHDPKIAGKTFEDFVKEADTNKDGRVSSEECVNWIEKYTGYGK